MESMLLAPSPDPERQGWGQASICGAQPSTRGNQTSAGVSQVRAYSMDVLDAGKRWIVFCGDHVHVSVLKEVAIRLAQKCETHVPPRAK